MLHHLGPNPATTFRPQIPRLQSPRRSQNWGIKRIRLRCLLTVVLAILWVSSAGRRGIFELSSPVPCCALEGGLCRLHGKRATQYTDRTVHGPRANTPPQMKIRKMHIPSDSPNSQTPEPGSWSRRTLSLAISPLLILAALSMPPPARSGKLMACPPPPFFEPTINWGVLCAPGPTAKLRNENTHKPNATLTATALSIGHLLSVQHHSPLAFIGRGVGTLLLGYLQLRDIEDWAQPCHSRVCGVRALRTQVPSGPARPGLPVH